MAFLHKELRVNGPPNHRNFDIAKITRTRME